MTACGCLLAGASLACSPTTHTYASSGSGGAAATTSTTGSGGATSISAGSGGSGGATMVTSCDGVFPGDGPDCSTCLQASCCSEVIACANDPVCMTCVTAHDPSACNEHTTATQALNMCWGTSCSVCLPEPACDPAVPSPSLGSCFTAGTDDKCNPITNGGCAADEACLANSAGFYCGITGASGLCGACDDAMGPYCGPGMTCSYDTKCGKWCCDDGDCGSGTCMKWAAQGGIHPEVGVCYEKGAFVF